MLLLNVLQSLIIIIAIAIGDYCLLIGLGVDFDSNPINVIFSPGEVSKSVNISLICDKIVEGRERFDISLTLISNNPQVRTGSRDRSTIAIKDRTGRCCSGIVYKGMINDQCVQL